MINIVILAFIFAISTALLALGYIYRTSFPMSFMWWLVGIIFMLFFLIEDSVEIDDRVLNITSTGSTFEVNYDSNVYPLKVQDGNGDYTLEPTFGGMMLIVLSIAFIMIGILIERT